MKKLLAIIVLSLVWIGNTQANTECIPDHLAGNCINGSGTMTFADGAKYVGEWKDNKYNGQGTYMWPDGTKYVGEWKDHNRNGQGTLMRPDGKITYVGGYKNGNKHGQGTYMWFDGTKYVGEWKDDNRNGQGTLMSPDGKIKYVGEYIDGKRKGKFSDSARNEKLSKTKNDQWEKIMDKIEIAKSCYLRNPNTGMSDIYSEMLLMTKKFGLSGLNNNPNETYLFIAEGRANQLISFLGCRI